MSATFESPREVNSTALLAVMVACSIVVHMAAVLLLPSHPPLQLTLNKPVELEIIELPPPPPPPPPAPEPEVEKPKPPPVKVKAPPPPKPDLPPPPNDTPPPETPPKPVPLVVGISMSSTTEAGAFAAPVGNTLYGKTADKAVDAQEVKPYAAPRYVPPGGADTDPEILGEVKIPYPPEAKKSDIEGAVRMKVTVDEHGTVTRVVLLSGPGYGLNEAAVAAIKRFRFKPATKGGEAVGTTIVYTYRFLLD